MDPKVIAAHREALANFTHPNTRFLAKFRKFIDIGLENTKDFWTYVLAAGILIGGGLLIFHMAAGV